MNEVPSGKSSTRELFSAPVVVAASAVGPSCATLNASASPTTLWVPRETTVGHASKRSVPSQGLAGRRA